MCPRWVVGEGDGEGDGDGERVVRRPPGQDRGARSTPPAPVSARVPDHRVRCVPFYASPVQHYPYRTPTSFPTGVVETPCAAPTTDHAPSLL